MTLREYQHGQTFPGRIARTYDVSEPAWPEPLRAREGAPNVVFVVPDDTGFGQLGCYGSPIRAPTSTGCPPFPFTGTLRSVTVEVGRDELTPEDPEAQMRIAMARQ